MQATGIGGGIGSKDAQQTEPMTVTTVASVIVIFPILSSVHLSHVSVTQTPPRGLICPYQPGGRSWSY